VDIAALGGIHYLGLDPVDVTYHILGDDVIGWAESVGLAVLHRQHPVRVPQCQIKVVQRDEHRAAVPGYDGPHYLQSVQLVPEIESAGRFIEDIQLRLLRESASKCDPLELPSRQLLHLAVVEIVDLHDGHRVGCDAYVFTGVCPFHMWLPAYQHGLVNRGISEEIALLRNIRYFFRQFSLVVL